MWYVQYVGLSTIRCSCLQALCLVGCKAVYPNQASVIAQELVNGGCSRLAMIEAGNQLPNAAPFPARPPPPPPLLYPAQGVAFKDSGSPADSLTRGPPGEPVDTGEDGCLAEGVDHPITDKLQEKDVSFSICISYASG